MIQKVSRFPKSYSVCARQREISQRSQHDAESAAFLPRLSKDLSLLTVDSYGFASLVRV